MKKKASFSGIDIRLRDPETNLLTQSGIGIFNPGDRVSGAVEIQPHERIKVRKVEVSLRWETQGKGNMNFQDIGKTVEDVDEILPENPLVIPFDWRMPSEPWSYHGHFITIVWKIKVKVDIPWARDMNDEQTLILEPLSVEEFN